MWLRRPVSDGGEVLVAPGWPPGRAPHVLVCQSFAGDLVAIAFDGRHRALRAAGPVVDVALSALIQDW